MQRCVLFLALLSLIYTSATGLTTVPEHCFLNACSGPVELIAGPEDSLKRYTVLPGDFMCVGVLSSADVKLPSGQMRRYDHASLLRLFPSLPHAYQGYWVIRRDGLHHVSRSSYIHMQRQLEHTKT
jgi:hypothetical protein